MSISGLKMQSDPRRWADWGIWSYVMYGSNSQGTGIQWISGKILEDLEYADYLALMSEWQSQWQSMWLDTLCCWVTSLNSVNWLLTDFTEIWRQFIRRCIVGAQFCCLPELWKRIQGFTFSRQSVDIVFTALLSQTT